MQPLELTAQKQVFRGEAGSVNGALINARANCTSYNWEINPDFFLKLLCVAGEQVELTGCKRKQLPLPSLLGQTAGTFSLNPWMETKDETLDEI